ncbi:STM4013/SEN3800 family hydrolase [Serratia microhaemolytica]|uniref:STM4013/SEN3800 family hydrolase n=1 Tax=Serratia microhaemolytica TaxID=2675110 RepID=UPI000FDDBE30|nr:STM4013/SEN3800 family hydrolase [Serratia microhaemolytica]
MKSLIGSHDILFITLDSLRFDVAQQAHDAGKTPEISRYLPVQGWQKCHAPGTFTYPSHQAFFAGFLPTPCQPGRHSRLFAARFAGSTTTDATTFSFDEPDLPAALSARGYDTICIGGVGFFNLRPPLGTQFPALFQQAYWEPSMGPASRHSTQRQVDKALAVLRGLPSHKRVLLFINVSATHQPTHIFTDAKKDSLETQTAALCYADSHLGRLFTAMALRRPTLVILCADHGEAFGEQGFFGHRLAHPSVWEVPYTQFILQDTSCR